MNYQEALDYINGTAQFGDKPGLERVAALLERLGGPHRRLQYVHVAGTNGKGSVCAFVESILRSAGYKTGLYISPFLEDYRERMQINRRLIPKETLAALIAETAEHCETLPEHPRKFEIETAAALQYFCREGCDIVVLETGLGGRLDATNVIPSPQAAVITSISYDHTKILGDTLDKIAYEKRGIIKPGCAVVESEALPPAGDIELSLSGSRFSYKGRLYEIGLLGAHQTENAVTAIETAAALRDRGWAVTDHNVREGLRAAKWAGRLEVVRRQPLCIIDGAHNQGAVEQLCAAADTLLAGRQIVTVMAMGEEKRYDLCVPMLAKRSARFIATEFRSMRPLPAAVLAGYAPGALVIPDTEDAVRKALELAGPDDAVLACGSLYMIGDAKRVMLT